MALHDVSHCWQLWVLHNSTSERWQTVNRVYKHADSYFWFIPDFLITAILQILQPFHIRCLFFTDFKGSISLWSISLFPVSIWGMMKTLLMMYLGLQKKHEMAASKPQKTFATLAFLSAKALIQVVVVTIRSISQIALQHLGRLPQRHQQNKSSFWYQPQKTIPKCCWSIMLLKKKHVWWHMWCGFVIIVQPKTQNCPCFRHGTGGSKAGDHHLVGSYPCDQRLRGNDWSHAFDGHREEVTELADEVGGSIFFQKIVKNWPIWCLVWGCFFFLFAEKIIQTLHAGRWCWDFVVFFADVFFSAFSMLGGICVKMGPNDLEEG